MDPHGQVRRSSHRNERFFAAIAAGQSGKSVGRERQQDETSLWPTMRLTLRALERPCQVSPNRPRIGCACVALVRFVNPEMMACDVGQENRVDDAQEADSRLEALEAELGNLIGGEVDDALLAIIAESQRSGGSLDQRQKAAARTARHKLKKLLARSPDGEALVKAAGYIMLRHLDEHGRSGTGYDAILDLLERAGFDRKASAAEIERICAQTKETRNAWARRRRLKMSEAFAREISRARRDKKGSRKGDER